MSSLNFAPRSTVFRVRRCRLRTEHDDVRDDMDHLCEERSQLQGVLRETRARAEEAKLTLKGADACLKVTKLELLKERNAVEGQSFSSSYVCVVWYTKSP